MHREWWLCKDARGGTQESRAAPASEVRDERWSGSEKLLGERVVSGVGGSAKGTRQVPKKGSWNATAHLQVRMKRVSCRPVWARFVPSQAVGCR